jgi:amino acid transporter
VSSHTQGVTTDLREGAVGLPEALMQGVSTIAPAFAIVATFQFTVGLVGLAAPVAYFLAFLVVATLAISVSQLAKAFPSAGGWYTWIARTIHPRAGFAAAWLFSLYTASAALTMSFFAKTVLEPSLKSEYGVTIPWWIVAIAGLVLVFVCAYAGISLSGKLLILFGTLEIVIMLALAVSGLVSPGDGGTNLSPFNPGNATSANSLYLAVVFSIFAFAGWEVVAPLAEETRNPRRNVPRALIGSAAILGGFFLITSWGYIVGLGTDHVSSIAGMSTAPPLVLAQRLWHGAWVIVLFALLNSSLAVSLATVTGATRMWYAMGRSGVLPRAFAGTHSVRRTPVNAINLQVGLTVIVFCVVLAFGAQDAFFTWGLMLTLGLIIVYALGSIGVMRYYLGEARNQLNVWLHVIFPLISTVAVLWVGYKSVVPLPDPPVRYAPAILGGWALIGAAILIVLKLRGQEEWLARAGMAMVEPDELEAEPEIAATARPVAAS